MTILNNARKNGTIKSESKIVLDEMESRMNEIRSKAKSNDEQNGNTIEENENQEIICDQDENAANVRMNYY